MTVTRLVGCKGHQEDPVRPHRSPYPSYRMVLAVVLLSAALGGCGDAGMLDGLGERGHDYVVGSTTLAPEAATETTQAPMLLSPVEGMRWYNEEIDGETVGEPSFVIGTVWGRSDGVTRFIQASPHEIAAALPNIEFPSLVPDDTFSITSQLVYDVASGTLDPELSAAFGFWNSTPYAGDNRSVAILRVAEGGDADPGQGVTVVPAEEGINIRWFDNGYSYELFCRKPLPEDVCQQIAVSSLPLEFIAPERPLES